MRLYTVKHNQTEGDICDVLLAGFSPEQPLKKRKIISTSEKGVCYKADVRPERETVVFKVDGCIIKDGDKCDRLVLSRHVTDENTWIGHFVELKGRHVGHAVKQLEQSLQHRVFSHQSLKEKYARIVGRSFPSNVGDPLLERARVRFKAQYRCELKCMKSNQPDCI